MIANIVVPTRLSQLADDTEHRTVTDTEKEKWNKPSITVDTELSETSNNPVSSKAVNNGLNELNNIFRENLQEMGQGFSEQLGTKANTTDIPTKLAQLADDTTHRLVTDEERTKWNALKNVNVVTEVTEENANSEDPISTKLVVQVIEQFQSMFESKEISPHRDFNLVGLDKNKLYVITKGFNDAYGYTELWFVFYGRENNKNDTLEDADGDDSISVNGVKVLERPLAYIRKRGTYFYTCGQSHPVRGAWIEIS